MEQLFKKLDSIMMNDIIRKLGGFVCLMILGVSAVAFFIGAGDLFGTGKKTESAVEADASGEHEDAEAVDEEDMEEEDNDEEDGDEEE